MSFADSFKKKFLPDIYQAEQAKKVAEQSRRQLEYARIGSLNRAKQSSNPQIAQQATQSLNNGSWRVNANPIPSTAQIISKSIASAPKQVFNGAVDTFVKPIARSANLAGNMVTKGATVPFAAYDITKESLFGTDQSYQRKLDAYNKYLRTGGLGKTGGLLNAGTGITNLNEFNDPKKLAGSILETGTNLGSFVPTGKAVQAGVSGTKAIKPLLTYGGGNAVVNTAGAAGTQLIETGKVDPKGLIAPAVMGFAFPVAGYGLGRGAKPAFKPTQKTVNKPRATKTTNTFDPLAEKVLNNKRNNKITTKEGMPVVLSAKGNSKYVFTGQDTPNSQFAKKMRITPKIEEAISKSQKIDENLDKTTKGIAPDGFSYHQVPVKSNGNLDYHTFDVGINNAQKRNTLYYSNIKETPASPGVKNNLPGTSVSKDTIPTKPKNVNGLSTPTPPKTEGVAPTKLYHGTNAEFDTFDSSKIGSTTDDGLYGRGFYFSNSSDYARQAPKGGAKIVMEVQVDVKNPLDLSKFKTKEELADYLDMSPDALTQDAGGFVRPVQSQINQFTSHVQEIGHDAVHIPYSKNGGKADEFVIFDSSKIKTTPP